MTWSRSSSLPGYSSPCAWQSRSGSADTGRLARPALTAALPALLAGLVVTGTVADGQTLDAGPRLAGVATGAAVAIGRGPLWLVVLTAVAVAAGLRSLGG